MKLEILKNWDWEDTFLSLLLVVCLSLITLFGAYVLSDKKVIRYSLDTDENSVVIVKEIAWYEDSKIPLDRSITYWDAIKMVDSLNATLKK